MNATTNNGEANNLTYLITAIAKIRKTLLQHADPSLLEDFIDEEIPTSENPLESLDSSPEANRLERLCTIFQLSEFESNLLLLCAGVELDASFGVLCAAACGNEQRTYATFGLAMTLLDGLHWSAFTPAGSLRRWRLIEVGSGSELMTSPLRIDERILHYLNGVQHLDERLLGIVEPVAVTDKLVTSQWQLMEKMVAAWWVEIHDFLKLPILQLCGNEVASKRPIAAVACQYLGLNLYTIAAHNIPTNPADLNKFKLLWEREVALTSSVLLIDCDDLETADTAREGAITYLCEFLRSPVIIATIERKRSRLRPLLVFDIERPTTKEQYTLWETALGTTTESMNVQIDHLVSQFNLSVPVIQAACSQVRVQWQQVQETQIEAKFHDLLWDSCRAQARPKLDDLAQRIDSIADWGDLVLPEAQIQVLRDVATHVKQRAKVYDLWGFGSKSNRGLGISALFAGLSGTGKTMAAEVLAQELRLDLYRIDLSAVVSKYIGETEKNLGRVFDAAELGGVILLFDEADALFGKRTEVKDSHDRHANVEVSYLLQRMESYRGLSVLTTNLKSSLDQAFLRRIRFVVQFPFPDSIQRAEIWRRIFPKATPTQGLEPQKLGQLNVAGGNIRSIALNAAFLAADAGEVVMMQHLLQAAKSEYIKLERTLTDTEIKGWVE
ncbi:ATP-binding protein [Anabaena subtropica]|uniref:ATP-binding protein n=1 Tax=Anabaena subtropica FACHB-260 TaxID=2692884 RepID=A0ABR8CKP1_9NOST|nr:ATP-binding protein [Anabaena subtropica]MBD2343786.1 ATP-binding protein [Anabaena subtropica FACHB-260]